MSDIELRFVTVDELRSTPAAEGKPATLAGYAAVFGSTSEDLGGFREIIAPGAFRDALAGGGDIRALFSHDPDQLLGRTSSGTLRLREDDKGLAFDLDVPDTTYARDMMEMVKRKDIRGMSFGFRTPKGGDSWAKAGGALIRTLHNIGLGEISVVASPAYRDTSLSVRVDPACITTAKNFVEFPNFVSRKRDFRTILIDGRCG